MSGARRLERALPLVLGVLALGLARARDGQLGTPGSHAALGATALVLALALAPGAARTRRASVRRLAVQGLVLVEAWLVPFSDVALGTGAWPAVERATRLLVLVGAALELVEFLRERGAPSPPAPGDRARRASGLAFGLAVALLAVLVVPYRLLAGERRVDLATLPRRALEGQARLATLPLVSLDAAPETGRVLEDGRPLPLDEAPVDAIAALGGGRHAVVPRGVVWSSSDGTDPLTNGRRYELVYRPDPHRSVFAETGFALAALLLLVAWSQGALDLERPSPRRERALATLLVGLALAASLPGRWDQIVVGRDSASYVGHHSSRPILYPAFLDAFDARPGEPREPLAEDPNHAHLDPSNRFLGAVHAQKLLALGAIVVLFWTLAGIWNAWLLAGVAWAAAQADLATYSDGGAAFGATSLMSEGLSFPLVLLLVAAAVAYLVRPSWPRGLAVSGLVGVLLLARPANVALVSVFFWLGLRHLLAGEGARRALGRVLVLGLVAALPVLGACAESASRTGYFRLHSFTGLNVFGTAFALATPDDVEAFPEPELHELVSRCLRDDKRISTEVGGYVNVNAYDIAIPALDQMRILPPPPRGDYVRDDLLLAVGKRLVRRHPVAFAGLVARQVLFTFEPWLHVPIALACALALVRLRRARSIETLAFLFLATLPLVAILPSCVFNFPLARYRSQLAWAELAALPLFLALFLGERPSTSTSTAPDPRL